jgi:L-fucose isomerase-like protein
MKTLSVGAIGARTTPFKTVRFDEIAMQKYGVTVETMDMADLFQRLDAVDPETDAFKTKMKKLTGVADSKSVPGKAMENMGRLAVVLDEIADEYGLGAMGIRCWTELQKRYGISPCLVTGEMADRGVPVSCEVDVANAVTMFALGAASGEPTSILDWNNNYGDDPNKCILFHCGNVPEKLMVSKGVVTDHAILSNDIGIGKGFGCNQGRIKPMEFTYGSMITIDGRMEFYLGKAEFTDDEIPKGFFGCAGVAEFPDLQDVLEWIGDNGHRHHVSLTPGDHVAALKEAFEKYLGYTVKVF